MPSNCYPGQLQFIDHDTKVRIDVGGTKYFLSTGGSDGPENAYTTLRGSYQDGATVGVEGTASGGFIVFTQVKSNC